MIPKSAESLANYLHFSRHNTANNYQKGRIQTDANYKKVLSVVMLLLHSEKNKKLQ